MGSGKPGVLSAVTISCALFGLAHIGWGPMGVVQTAFMGLALAIAFVKLKRNLWILVLAHAYMDTLLIVPLFLKAG
jgi:membrane protease YdiL (CAAX protease family)